MVRDGYNYAANIQLIPNTYVVEPAKELKKGTYRNINGNQALAWGLLAAAEKSGLSLFCGSPRHPAYSRSWPSTRASGPRPSRPRTR